MPKPRQDSETLERMAQECKVVRVRLLNRVLTNIYDEALRPFRLKASQMNILVVVGRLGLARPADACRALQLDASTLSRNVTRMKSRGWLEAIPDSDGRAHHLRLTPRGLAVLDRARPAWEEAQEKAEALLGPESAPFLEIADQYLSGNG